MGLEFRKDVAKIEQRLHDGEAKWEVEKRDFANKIRDLERNLEGKTNEVGEFKRLFRE